MIVSALETQTPCCYSFFFVIYFSFFIPLSYRNLRSLLLFGNRRDRIQTLTQLVEWSSFVVDYFIP